MVVLEHGDPSRKAHVFCNLPSREDWTVALGESPFPPGTFWMCDECHKVYMTSKRGTWLEGYALTFRNRRKANRLRKEALKKKGKSR